MPAQRACSIGLAASGKPDDHLCSVLRPADKFHQAAIVLDLFGDNQLAVYEVSYRHMIGRAAFQGILYFAFEIRVPPFQVHDGWLRHDTLQYRGIVVGNRNNKNGGDVDQASTNWGGRLQVWENNPEASAYCIEKTLSSSARTLPMRIVKREVAVASSIWVTTRSGLTAVAMPGSIDSPAERARKLARIR
jgi:hypothetical protein